MKRSKNYLELQRNTHEVRGSLGVVALDINIRFSAICLGNGDMIVGAPNSAKTIYSSTTQFDGVGVLGKVNVMCSYKDSWSNVSSLALSGNELAICADGVLHLFFPSQNETKIITGKDGLHISSKAVNVSWLEKDILLCEEHSVKLFQLDRLTIIAGQGQGDTDGMQSHSKLCQQIGICVEFNHNIYVADSGSGAVKIINRPLRGIYEFLGKLQMLVKAFNIHSKKSVDKPRRMSLDEAIVVVDKVHEYVKSCSKKARELQYLKRETTDGPEGTLSSKCLKSLELMAHSLGKLQNNINDLSSLPGFRMNLNQNVENQHAVTHFKKETFTLGFGPPPPLHNPPVRVSTSHFEKTGS